MTRHERHRALLEHADTLDDAQVVDEAAEVDGLHAWTLARSSAALGYSRRGFRVHIFDLAAGYGIDGLVGLSFPDAFNYEVRSRDATLRVSEV